MKGGYIYFNDNGKCWSYYALWIADLRDIWQKMLVHTLEKILLHTWSVALTTCTLEKMDGTLKKMPVHTLEKMFVHTLEKMLPHTLKKLLMP